MKRNRITSRPRAPQGVKRLVDFINKLVESGSRVEDIFWENLVQEEIVNLLEHKKENVLNTALEQLSHQNDVSYDALADTIETCIESIPLINGSQKGTALFFAIPILVWSRYQIPAGPIAKEQLIAIKKQLHQHVFGEQTKIILCTHLLAPDQLPRGYVETYALSRDVLNSGLKNQDHPIEPNELPNPLELFTDARFILGLATIPEEEPLFRWQNEEDQPSREQVRTQWVKQGTETIRSILPACAFDLSLPGAYFSVCRATEQSSRPYSLKAAIALLSINLGVQPEVIHAIISACHHTTIEEYRISLTTAERQDIYIGTIWPQLYPEESSSAAQTEIKQVLRECGVINIHILDQEITPEYCEDCGTPLFPNIQGEMIHPAISEHTEENPNLHLH